MGRPWANFVLVTILALVLAGCGGTWPAGQIAANGASASPLPPAQSTPAAISSPAASGSPATATMDVPTPMATSRGPNLEASNPEAARLDSGSLQLVEFFRFT